MKAKTVLLVDDEKHILQSLRRLLRKEDYNLLTAECGREALAHLASHEIQLVLSDQRMPDMQGTDFLQEVKQKHPDTVRVILSGYADVGIIVEAINQGEVYRFIPKPWNDEELKASIRQCLEHYDILAQNARLLEQTNLQNAELKRLNARLEENVQHRTKSLELSQEILEEIPLGIIGVSMESEIILVNNYARNLVPASRQYFLGVSVGEVLPEELLHLVESSLRGERQGFPLNLEWDRTKVSAQAVTLGKGDNKRGCILIIAADHNVAQFERVVK